MGSMNLWQPATATEKGANSHLSLLGDIKSIRVFLQLEISVSRLALVSQLQLKICISAVHFTMCWI